MISNAVIDLKIALDKLGLRTSIGSTYYADGSIGLTLSIGSMYDVAEGQYDSFLYKDSILTIDIVNDKIVEIDTGRANYNISNICANNKELSLKYKRRKSKRKHKSHIRFRMIRRRRAIKRRRDIISNIP